MMSRLSLNLRQCTYLLYFFPIIIELVNLGGFPLEFHLQFSCFVTDGNICHFITPSHDDLCELHCSNRCLLCAAWHLQTVGVRYLFAIWVCNWVKALNIYFVCRQTCQPLHICFHSTSLQMNLSIIVLNTLNNL